MTMREADIRSAESYDALVSSASDLIFSMTGPDDFEGIPCPACGTFTRKTIFHKGRFMLATCASCGSLFVSPRPDRQALNHFYAAFGGFSKFYDEKREARIGEIVKVRARRIIEMCDRHCFSNDDKPIYCDVGCGDGSTVAEVAKFRFFSEHIGIDPNLPAPSAGCDVNCMFFRLPIQAGTFLPKADFVTAFEVVEHVYWPREFLSAIRQMLPPRGVLMFTTLTCDGWDIGELWENHRAVCPPLHLNLMSMSGIRELVADCGFELLSMSTPGRLDVDIVRNVEKEKPGLQISRFARRIVEGPDALAVNFQRFLRENGLSSHVEVIARKAPDG